jgi:hypothetical protein
LLKGLKPSAIAQLDLQDPSNLMAAKHVKIGFGARTYLKKLKQNNPASERQILQFRQECAVFLLNTCLTRTFSFAVSSCAIYILHLP